LVTEAWGSSVRYKAAVVAMAPNSLIDSICDADYQAALQRTAELVNTPNTLELPETPVDPRLLVIEVTHTDGTVQQCRNAQGFVYTAPAGTAPARATLTGTCRLHPGDKIQMKLVCAQ
jgi:hypothetical protein